MDVIDIIIAKREARELSDEQIDWLIPAYTAGGRSEERRVGKEC